ncbi:flavodoxin domain-containing protein [Niastella sp. OAS944]|uniref:flavodoxin domain-containing protein n=1 Tax=Niastella sp. OAS944 TaxID=2664089 RepID=UPI0034785571|nr:menaquinone-dependent protoporphyrinogen IX oxidase [Chitinophagaceae bacterium OAS944]
MKGIIVYKGKYGATRQYATWIGEALNWPLFTPEQLLNQTLDDADVVIVGGSVYAGQLTLHDWLKKHAHQLLRKKVFLFIVCATPADKKDVLEQIAKHNIPALLQDLVTVFYFRGRLVINDLSWLHKLMLKLASRTTNDADEKERMVHGFDAMNKDNILPLLQLVNDVQTSSFNKVAGRKMWAD